MLHVTGQDLSHLLVGEIEISAKDREVLRSLASQVAEIASLDVHQQKAELWRKVNDLESERPMVLAFEVCWNEMNVDDELTCVCEHPWARGQEEELRQTLYQWRHMPADMIVSDFLACPLVAESTGFGLVQDADIVKTDESSRIVSRHFHAQIREPEDIEKIKMPKVRYNEAATQAWYNAMCDVYDGILPVQKVGKQHTWFTPWDYLITWWDIEQAMMDMVLRPDMVHVAVERMVDGWLAELEQFEAKNLLSLDNCNVRVGSGGYGYTKELPGNDYDPQYVRPKNQWGCSNAQIFSEVSPQMHWDFAIEHDLKWLERFGLTYYGCCEPLDKKVELLRRIPNLRKISVSPWCDLDRILDEIGSDYVVSRKPSPAILADASWDEDLARRDIREVLEKAGGKCHIEFIMKDISTVRYEPQRLWEWTRIAMEEVENYG